MKDLKHLIFFENLLQDAQNELVTQAVNDGKIALGYNCYYIPEVLLNLPGCFSSRLRATIEKFNELCDVIDRKSVV